MIIKPGTYRHYKGPLYKVIGVGKHTETEENLVFYQSLYGNFDLWARPLSMWIEDVEFEGKIVPRFALINESTQSE
jgi:hypothetical protein